MIVKHFAYASVIMSITSHERLNRCCRRAFLDLRMYLPYVSPKFIRSDSSRSINLVRKGLKMRRPVTNNSIPEVALQGFEVPFRKPQVEKGNRTEGHV